LLEPTVLQLWDARVPIVGTHCCATVTWFHICARMTCDVTIPEAQ
jgi:hypothetical protein